VRRFVPLLALLTCLIPVTAQPIIQSLPITAKAKVGGQVIELEVARSALEHQIGLMGRKDLAPNRGMLFIFDPPQFSAFWMRNCLMSLDLIFIRKGKIVNIAENAPPCPDNVLPEKCPTYPAKGQIDQVLDLKAGQAKALKLKANDPIEVTFLKTTASRGG